MEGEARGDGRSQGQRGRLRSAACRPAGAKPAGAIRQRRAWAARRASSLSTHALRPVSRCVFVLLRGGGGGGERGGAGGEGEAGPREGESESEERLIANRRRWTANVGWARRAKRGEPDTSTHRTSTGVCCILSASRASRRNSPPNLKTRSDKPRTRSKFGRPAPGAKSESPGPG